MKSASICTFIVLAILHAHFILSVPVVGDEAPAGFDEAMKQFRAGNYEQSITIFRTVVAKEPSFFEAHLSIAVAQFHLGKFVEAESGFELCSRLAPHRTESYFWSGRVSEMLKKHDQAKAAYRIVLSLDATNTAAIDALAKLEHRSEGNAISNSNSGNLPTWAWPLIQWQYYCLMVGLVGTCYVALRKLAPLDQRTKAEMAEAVRGGVGGFIGREAGIRELEAIGSMHARLHLNESARAFTTQCRMLLGLATLGAVMGAWAILYWSAWNQVRNEVWWSAAGVGTFLLWKNKWAFR